MKVFEAFSGIGSQAKAFDRTGIPYEIIATCDWDISAIIAYDLIHHGIPTQTRFDRWTKDDLLKHLEKYSLSVDGKKVANYHSRKRLSIEVLISLANAIERSNNLVSIVDVKAQDITEKIDLLTYSFPCQDLSVAKSWHGMQGGIDRISNNRSNMLWQIERIIEEMFEAKMELPRFLLMENVAAITGNAHKENFEEWKDILVDFGYYNHVMILNAEDFGIPQRRRRAFMLSIYIGEDKNKKVELEQYFFKNVVHNFAKDIVNLEEVLQMNYDSLEILEEALQAVPNDTPSRKSIYKDNLKLNRSDTSVKTITTKQDRNPNAGIIDFNLAPEGKSKFRYLTPRECFLLMGFDNKDYQILKDSNLMSGGKKFFADARLYKLTGNSIVVNVLEAIFKQIEFIDKNILNSDN